MQATAWVTPRELGEEAMYAASRERMRVLLEDGRCAYLVFWPIDRNSRLYKVLDHGRNGNQAKVVFRSGAYISLPRHRIVGVDWDFTMEQP